MGLRTIVHITADDTVTPPRSATEVYEILSSTGSYTKGGVTITYDENNTEYMVEIDPGEVVPVATTEVAGKVKPDGTTITVTADGTITSIGGGTTVEIDII